MTTPNQNDSNGFTSGGGQFGVVANPNSLPQSNSTGNDFAGMDWKHIMAAVTGAAAYDNSDPTLGATMKAVSDPTTLYDAANVLYTVQQNVNVLATALQEQTDALAGPDGPWQGQAASQFHDTMISLQGQVAAISKQLFGGDPSNPSGPANVANQLWNDGNYLDWAINTINNIDSYYGALAVQEGAPVFGDGLVHIATNPQLVSQMTADMLTVANGLAKQYTSFTVNPQSPPANVQFDPNNNPNIPPPPPPPPPPPESNLSTSPPPGLGSPPPGLGSPPPGLGSPPPGLGGGNGNVPPFSGGLSGPGANGGLGAGPGLGGGVGNVPPFSGNLSGPGANGGLGAGPGTGGLGGVVPPFPGNLNAPKGASNLDAATNGKGSGAGLANFPIGNTPAGTNLGQLGGAGAGGLGARVPGTALGNGGLGGLGTAGAGSVNPSALKPADFTTGAGPGAGGAGLQNPQAGAVPAGEPMFPPGMSGAGGAGNQPASSRPDSAGLLGGVSEPWKVGLPSVVGDPGILGDTPAGSPASWASSGGVPGPAVSSALEGAGSPTNLAGQVPGTPNAGAVPAGEPMFPPGMSGAGGAGNQQPPARPDSAGLLGGVSEPWQGSPLGNGDPGSAGDTPAGSPASWASGGGVPAVSSGAGVTNSLTSVPRETTEPSGPAVVPFVEPLLPGVPGGGIPDSQQAPARPDSAGLLGSVSQPWQGGPRGNVSEPGGARTPEPGALEFRPAAVSPSGADGTAREAETSTPLQIAGSVGPATQPDRPLGWIAALAAGVPAGAAPPAEPSASLAGPAVPPPVDYPPAAADVPVVADVQATAGQAAQNASSGGNVRDVRATADVRPVGQDSGRLPIVSFPENRVDTSTWDVGAAEFLLLASASTVAESGGPEAKQSTAWDPLPPSGPGPAQTGSEPDSSGLTVYQRRTARDGAELVDEPVLRCSGAPVPEPSVSASENADEKNPSGKDDDDKDEDEDDELRMGDLLNQDLSAWGDRRSNSSGVLE